VQSRLPVYLGGSGPLTMKHAAEWADVWYPTPPTADPHLTEAMPRFRRLVAEAGRDPESVPVGIAPASCTAADLETYARNGVAQVNVALVADTPADMLAQLDRLQAMRIAVLGR
jgi:alkanesulfonate monooxygenase SsuD/methylene tetrahydromethanopterin reductase-like flavin-dependent oxidoreductase (luciferase family)